MILAAIAGFGIATAAVIWWRLGATKADPPSTFRPAPYSVLGNMTDEQIQEHPAICLRRYHAVSCVQSESGLSMVVVITRHFATEEEAAAELAYYREQHPGGTVVPIVLAFDPDNPDAVDAFFRIIDGGQQ